MKSKVSCFPQRIAAGFRWIANWFDPVSKKRPAVFNDSLGGRIKRLAMTVELSVPQLAEKANIPKRSMNNYASDEQLPGAIPLIKLHGATGVNLNWLVSGIGPMFFGVNQEHS